MTDTSRTIQIAERIAECVRAGQMPDPDDAWASLDEDERALFDGVEDMCGAVAVILSRAA